MNAGNAVVTAVLFGVVTTVCHAQLPASTASFTTRTGISGGLCSFPRAGTNDTALALALAQSSNFVVHLMSQDDTVVANLRAAADSAGLLGRSIYVEEGGDGQTNTLPYADRLVDVLVVTDLSDADLTAARKTEWCRVIAPVRGAALVGRSAAAGAGLTTNALQAWLADLPLSTVSSDTSGVCSVIRTNLPAGSEAWTHRAHGADNNQVSMDTTFQAPFLPQWFGLPRTEGFWGTAVVSGNGRVFTLRGSRNKTSQIFMTARSSTSGIVLWQKSLLQPPGTPHNGFIPGRSCAAVDGDSLYLIRTNGVLRLHGETGAEAGFIVGPQTNGSVKWISVENGRLGILSGDPDLLIQRTYQTYTTNSYGTIMAVYDVANTQELWRATVAGGIDERLIARRDNKIYYLEQGVGVACRDWGTGAIQWTSADSNLVAAFTPPPVTYAWGETLISQPSLMALEDILFFRSIWTTDMYAISRTNGATLWTLPHSTGNSTPLGRAVVPVAMSNKWITGVGSYDLKTGTLTSGPSLQQLINMDCAIFTATPRYLISTFGGIRTLNGTTTNWLRSLDLKAPCDEGTIVSDGMMISAASECGCTFPVKGYRTLASAGSMDPATAPVWSDRLVVVDTNEPALLPVDAADWPTYRRDAQRSGGSSALVGNQVKVLWRYRPSGSVPYRSFTNAPFGIRLAPDFLSTAPVAAAGLVWFGTPDGQVRCVQADTGAEVWSFPTAGPLYAPPTLWKGRLLVGGSDGRVYCLDASTGRLLWKFLAAPFDRRMFWYGHLINTWPLFGGVVVQNDIAYTVAGNQRDGGIRAYALNPQTGQVIWERSDVGDGFWVNPNDSRTLNPLGLENNGCLAVDSNRLWVASYPRGALDLQTGSRTSFPETIGRGRTGSQFGSQIGVLGNWVFQGGRKLSETQDALAAGLYPGGDAEAFNDRNSTNMSGYILSPGALSLPVWDADLVLLTGAPTGDTWGPAKLTAVPRTNLLARLETSLAATISAWRSDKTWETTNMFTAAYALSQNMALAAHVDVVGDVYGATVTNSHLTAFRRSDGSKAWSVDLPDQPMMSGLAIDRNGRALVTLSDGSVVGVGIDGVPPTVATPASAATNPVTGISVALSVLGADDTGETNLTYTWSTTGTPPAPVTFSPNGSNTAKNCTALFTQAGAYALTVAICNGAGLTVNSSTNVTVSQTLTGVAVTPASATVPNAATRQFAASGLDQFGSTMSAATTWSVSGGGTVDSNGLFTATTLGGPYVVRAISGGLTGTASVTVSPPDAAPTVATAAAVATNPVTGTSVALSVLGADDGGEANLVYAWATTGTPPAVVTFSANSNNVAKNTTATFTKAGGYGFQAVIQDAIGQTVTSCVGVTVGQTLTGLTVGPVIANVITNATQAFTASGLSQFGQAMTVTPAWSVTGGGTISTGGLFMAGGSIGGPYTVSAISGTKTGTASVTVIGLSATALYQMKTSASAWVNCNITNGASLMDLWDGSNHTTLAGSSYVWTLPAGGLDIGTQQVYNTTDTNGFKLDLSGGVLIGTGTLATARGNRTGSIIVTNAATIRLGSINTSQTGVNQVPCGSILVNHRGALTVGTVSAANTYAYQAAGTISFDGNSGAAGGSTGPFVSGNLDASSGAGLASNRISIQGYTDVLINGYVSGYVTSRDGDAASLLIGTSNAPVGNVTIRGTTDLHPGGFIAAYPAAGSLRIYSTGNVLLQGANGVATNFIATTSVARGMDSCNVTISHDGQLVFNDITTVKAPATQYWTPAAEAITLNGDALTNGASGSLTGRDILGYCTSIGVAPSFSVTISGYTNVSLRTVDTRGDATTYTGGAGTNNTGAITITNIAGSITISGNLLTSNAWSTGSVAVPGAITLSASGNITVGGAISANSGRGNAYHGTLTLTAGGSSGTITLNSLDLGLVKKAMFQAGGGKTTITNALLNFPVNASTNGLLDAVTGQKVLYKTSVATNAYLAGGVYPLKSGGVLAPWAPNGSVIIVK